MILDFATLTWGLRGGWEWMMLELLLCFGAKFPVKHDSYSTHMHTLLLCSKVNIKTQSGSTKIKAWVGNKNERLITNLRVWRELFPVSVEVKLSSYVPEILTTAPQCPAERGGSIVVWAVPSLLAGYYMELLYAAWVWTLWSPLLNSLSYAWQAETLNSTLVQGRKSSIWSLRLSSNIVKMTNLTFF